MSQMAQRTPRPPIIWKCSSLEQSQVPKHELPEICSKRAPVNCCAVQCCSLSSQFVCTVLPPEAQTNRYSYLQLNSSSAMIIWESKHQESSLKHAHNMYSSSNPDMTAACALLCMKSSQKNSIQFTKNELRASCWGQMGGRYTIG